ncbi:acyltransferase [Sporosarcina sp. P26b]|uniref:acyltransferase n=1 Tax=Sporosarcina sp. P26b TaxID=2048253 RepID=UPI00130455A7|nr:acyltransferase [Sporosarcina sp. P26b]
MKNIEFQLEELISFSTKIRIKGKGKVILKKKVGTRRNVELAVDTMGVISIGKSCFFNNNCMVVAHEKILIGDYCSFGPNVLIYDHDHDFRAYNGIKSGHFKTSTIEIGNNVWVGANSIILRGSKIGDNCVIAAGSVIKGEYKSNSIVLNEREERVVEYDYEGE